jgi:hypothetical protein
MPSGYVTRVNDFAHTPPKNSTAPPRYGLEHRVQRVWSGLMHRKDLFGCDDTVGAMDCTTAPRDMPAKTRAA